MEEITYYEFMQIVQNNPVTSKYLNGLYTRYPYWKQRNFYCIYIDGQRMYGLKDEHINKYMVKQYGRTFNK